MADAPAILPLIAAQYDEHAIVRAPRELEAGIAGLVDHPERGAVLVAARPGHDDLAGLAVVSFTWTLENGGRTAWLDELYVTPGHRGSGLGTSLLEAVIAIADAEGCLAIELEVDHDHARAEALYQRYGFRVLPRRRLTRVQGR